MKNLKKVFGFLLATLMVFSLVGCSSKKEEVVEVTETVESKGKIAVVTDVGQLNDGGFNQGTYEGAVAFGEANGYEVQYFQPANGSDATDDDRIAAMRQAVEWGAEVVVLPGYLQYTALDTVAGEATDVKWVFVDGWAIGKENVTAISYHEEESGFLAGYAAVKDGYTSLGGTFGGAGTNAACNRFAYGYVQGIEAAAADMDETVDVVVSFLYGGSFAASTELQTQISGWYNNGTQVVFSCGGSMLQSVKAAAAETADGKIIGVDVDQAGESDRVITSATKGLSASVEKVLGEWQDGKWDTDLADKCSNLGAADNATGLPTAADSWRFTTFTLDDYNALFTKVANGEVTISTDCADMSTAAAWDTLKAASTHINLVTEY